MAFWFKTNKSVKFGIMFCKIKIIIMISESHNE